MPRTLNQIEYTDHTAELIRYQTPPAELEPTGPMWQDLNWARLGDWFELNTQSWHDSLLVYILRRWDTPLESAYHDTDGWMKDEFKRRDRRDDPAAVVSYN